MRAAEIGKALRGHRSADGFLCRCPVPSHGKGKGDRRPSLLVKDGEVALLVTCFGGCERRDVIDTLRRMNLLDERDACEAHRQPLRERVHRPEPDPEPDHAAVELWQRAEPIGGTVAERYLRDARGVALPAPPTLRFVPSLVYPHAGHAFPAMVAAVQRADRKIIAVQVTFLRADGSKAPVSAPRLTVGRLGSGAVRLAAAGEVLGLAEGVETALSAMQLADIPCWASLGGHRLGKIRLPDSVREVHVFADNDDAGQLAAQSAAERYSRQGRRVIVRSPPDGRKDWNDHLRQASRVAA